MPPAGPGNWPKESAIKWEFNRETFVLFKQSMHENLGGGGGVKKSFPTRHCTLWCNPPRIGFWVSTGAKKSAGISFVPEKKARGSLGWFQTSVRYSLIIWFSQLRMTRNQRLIACMSTRCAEWILFIGGFRGGARAPFFSCIFKMILKR